MAVIGKIPHVTQLQLSGTHMAGSGMVRFINLFNIIVCMTFQSIYIFFINFYNKMCICSTGYEIVGMENIPQDKPVLFIYYHGAIPIDLYYFMAKVFLFNSKLIHTVADRFLFNFPGWSIMSDVMKSIPGTIQTCSIILKEGNLLAISPGGVYEAQFSNSYYQLMWKKRIGFAKVALDSKVVCHHLRKMKFSIHYLYYIVIYCS